ncbi:hypothetical protein E2C01_087010 [Portunus trituberculatus]|uniref:Uncharacterized protein n=1 Tax=Portunus trituberculatus TaxID=210409 RepID=A0A5B7JHX7_PORTR|nr:hypothetical protein [Portunus trituberculatus]
MLEIQCKTSYIFVSFNLSRPLGLEGKGQRGARQGSGEGYGTAPHTTSLRQYHTSPTAGVTGRERSVFLGASTARQLRARMIRRLAEGRQRGRLPGGSIGACVLAPPRRSPALA